MKKLLAFLTFLSCVIPFAVFAEVTVEQPWVRGTVAAQKATGAFMAIKSNKPLTLIAAASPAAQHVEIHQMSMDAGVMKMRAIPRVDVLPGKTVELKPGGYHVMLMDLVRPLSKGEVVPITLTFEDADKKKQTIEVRAEVRALGADEGHKHH